MYIKAIISIFSKICLQLFVCLRHLAMFQYTFWHRYLHLSAPGQLTKDRWGWCSWWAAYLMPGDVTRDPNPGCSPGNRCSLELMSRFSGQPRIERTGKQVKGSRTVHVIFSWLLLNKIKRIANPSLCPAQLNRN